MCSFDPSLILYHIHAQIFSCIGIACKMSIIINVHCQMISEDFRLIKLLWDLNWVPQFFIHSHFWISSGLCTGLDFFWPGVVYFLASVHLYPYRLLLQQGCDTPRHFRATASRNFRLLLTWRTGALCSHSTGVQTLSIMRFLWHFFH